MPANVPQSFKKIMCVDFCKGVINSCIAFSRKFKTDYKNLKISNIMV